MDIPEDLARFNLLPTMARANYDAVMDERMPGLEELVENHRLIEWAKAAVAKEALLHTALIPPMLKKSGISIMWIWIFFLFP